MNIMQKRDLYLFTMNVRVLFSICGLSIYFLQTSVSLLGKNCSEILAEANKIGYFFHFITFYAYLTHIQCDTDYKFETCIECLTK